MQKVFYSIIFILLSSNSFSAGPALYEINQQGLCDLTELSIRSFFTKETRSLLGNLCCMEAQRFEAQEPFFYTPGLFSASALMFRIYAFGLLSSRFIYKNNRCSVLNLLISMVVPGHLLDTFGLKFDSRRIEDCADILCVETFDYLIYLVSIWVCSINKKRAAIKKQLLKSAMNNFVRHETASWMKKSFGKLSVLQQRFISGASVDPSLSDSPFSPKDAAAKVVEAQFQDRVARALSYD